MVGWRHRTTPAAQPAPVSFAKDIFPVLEANCLTCHGATMQLAKLDLRTRESALAGGAHGPAIVPGNAEQSRLFRRITGAEAPAMPMSGDPLTSGSDRRDQGLARSGCRVGGHDRGRGSGKRRRDQVPPLLALERMDITPEQRNYWAFKLPVQAPVPVVANKDLSNPIDRFLEKTRVDRRLKAAPRATRLTLVRRAYLDLLGLPPTPAQVAAFMADQTPHAWEHLIDTLLASPHYGERYGRHWLDVARYADSGGFEYDVHRPNAWRYRDYVIKSFNDDKPYNQFIVEQLAGDEMDWKTDQTLIATGFLRMGPRVLFREKDNPERRFDYLDEIIGTIGKGTMGLTVNCARCHNHKFDPIAAKDYYAMQASLFGYVETEVPLAPRAEAEAYQAKNDEINAKLAALKAAIAAIEKPHRDTLELEQIRTRFAAHIYRAAAKPERERTPGEKLLAIQVYEAVNVPAAQLDKVMSAAEVARKRELTAQIKALEAQRPAPLPMAEIATDGDHRFSPLGEGDDTVSCPKCRIPPPFPGSYLHKDGKYQVPPSYFLIRGDPESRGSLMKPGFIGVITYGNPPTEIPRPDGNTSGRRLALAQWIGSQQNPLTARVIVNRLWQKHFGRGIVATLENFGKMGGQPTPSGTARLDGRRVHEPRLEHQADQQADDDVGGLPDGLRVRRRRQFGDRPGEPLSVAVQAAAARGRDRPRQHARGRRQHQPGRWRRADLSVHSAGNPGRPVPRQVGDHAGRPGGLAPWRLRLSAPVAAVPDVRHLRPSRHERHRRREERLDRSDPGADAAEQSVRAVASQVAGGSRQP